MNATLASPDTPRFDVLPPLALYVHFPWCIRKCPYCDFNSHALREAIPEDAYVDALIADLEHALPSIWGRRVGSIFMGGGTPSLFSAAAIDRVVAAVRARVPLAPDAEITLEANPGTFERDKFAGFRDAGINRLSIGVQSFDDRFLASLGRVHDASEAYEAAASAISLFDRVNLDLMYALPRQTRDDALADLAKALALGPTHLSLYSLTIEPNTAFHHAPPPLPDDDACADIELAVHETLAGAGYRRYEISAHAKPGVECRHNLNYWRFGDYLGIGAGAHSKLSFADRIERQVRWKHPQRYLEKAPRGSPVMERRAISRVDAGFEFMLNALRLVDGVPASLFAERTGFPLAIVASAIELAVRRGLLDADPRTIKATSRGLSFLNDLQALFLPDDATPATSRVVAGAPRAAAIAAGSLAHDA